MILRIPCFCGRELSVDLDHASTSVTCPACGWVHSVPTAGAGGVLSAREGGSGSTWSVAGSSAGLVIVAAALLWALLAGGGGMGSGGRGKGTGFLDGDGSGTGQTGDGPGAAASGEGTGGETRVAQEQPKPAAPAARQPRATPAEPSPAGQAAEPPTTQPAEEPVFALRPLSPKSPTPPSPSPQKSPGEPGREGSKGGGGFGPGQGSDPGAKGDASFTLTWSYDAPNQGTKGRGGPDIDIWVRDPLGQVINTSKEGIGKGPTPEGGQADFDDRGAYGTREEGDGGGPERIFWPAGKAPKGKYTFGVRWFQGVGTARYTLRVYRGSAPPPVITKQGTLTESDKGENKELGTITVE